LPVLEVEHLPDPVHTVNLAVVEVESRVTRGDEGISTRVAADGEVASAVDAYRVGRSAGIAVLDLVRACRHENSVDYLTISPEKAAMLFLVRIRSVVLRKVVHCFAILALRSRLTQRGLFWEGSGTLLEFGDP